MSTNGQGPQLTGPQKTDRSKGGAGRRRGAEISIVTINGNFWTTHAEWMAHVGPRHLVLVQESSNVSAGDAVSRPRNATL